MEEVLMERGEVEVIGEERQDLHVVGILARAEGAADTQVHVWWLQLLQFKVEKPEVLVPLQGQNLICMVAPCPTSVKVVPQKKKGVMV
jgi:hypothetical protein